jgi:hypothetical protein
MNNAGGAAEYPAPEQQITRFRFATAPREAGKGMLVDVSASTGKIKSETL